MRQKYLILAAVSGHLLLTIPHGLVHAAVPVLPTGRSAAFAVIFLYILPVMGAGLVVSNHRNVGAALLLTAGIIGLAFEGVMHFVIVNPDHVLHVSKHRTAFGLTAVLTTASNLLILAAGYLSGRDGWLSTNKMTSTIDG